MFTLKQIEMLRQAAEASGTIIANGLSLIETEWGTKSRIGTGNIFLHCLEVLTDTRPGRLQIKD